VSEICTVDDCNRPVSCRELCGMHYSRLARHGSPSITLRTRHSGTPSERFWKRTEKTDKCWYWRGRIARNGYGMYSTGTRTNMAHRFAYTDVVGAIPNGYQLDHLCHNRACVNPSHLRLATNKQNNENPAGLNSNNTTGYRGVRYNKKNKRWYGRVQHDGKQLSCGGHETAEQAAEAARQLRLLVFTHNDADRRT